MYRLAQQESVSGLSEPLSLKITDVAVASAMVDRINRAAMREMGQLGAS